MRARRLEEVLEECLSAYVEGRRSIAESLSLYPALAGQLEPLLRTAAHVADTYGRAGPPPHVMQRVRERFLFEAATRKRARTLAGGIGAGRLALPRWLPQLSVLGPAAAVALGVVIISAALLTNGSGGGGETAFNTAAAPQNTESVVAAVQNLSDRVKDATAAGKPIDDDTLQRISDNNAQIATDPGLTEEPSPELQAAVHELVLSLTTAAGTPSQPPDPHLDSVIRDTLGVAGQLNIPVPTFNGSTVTPAPSGAASATPAETPSATLAETPAATATPEPATATPAPTAAPTPAPTDDIRQPQIGP